MIRGIHINHGQFFLYGGGVGGLGSELPCHKTSIRIFFIYFEFYFIFFRNLEKLIKLITSIFSPFTPFFFARGGEGYPTRTHAKKSSI